MVKKGKGKGKGKSSGGSFVKDVHVEDFTSVATVSLAAGVNTLSVSPNISLSTRLADIGDTYSLYRVRKLKFRLRRVGTIGGAYQAACFVIGVTDSKPSNIPEARACLHCSLVSAVETVPSNWVNVPPRALEGMQPWYKTVAGTPDVGQEVMGVIQLVGTLTESISVEVCGRFEFCAPIEASNTPAMQLARKIIHDERVRIAQEEWKKNH
jgi:hypothetical protein